MCPPSRTLQLRMEDSDVKPSNGMKKQLSNGVNGEAEVFYSDSTEDECSRLSSGTCSSPETLSSGVPEHKMKQPSFGWPMCNASIRQELLADELRSDLNTAEDEELKYSDSDVELMKERFSKLLLGEDMSGCGKGVCAASAISNAITNLCATVFGQLWRLEPLPPEKKSMWRREMEWLLCVSDHIVELIPSCQTFPDGSKLEVMTCRPRSDLFINLPALRKLDHMLLEILESFKDQEFWYVDQGIQAPDSDGSASFRKSFQRQEDKWWLPVPRVPQGGLHEKTRTKLQHTRECVNQILKAAMAINSNALAEMEVPESYLNSLPKNGRASLGDVIYRYICSIEFSPERLLDCLAISSEHQALEIADRAESAMYVWRKHTVGKQASSKNGSNSKSSWSVVKDIILDADKRELYAERAESLLLCLKQRFPGLTQTTLDMSKIQYNKDVGKSILESYSRVLESLAFNIVARLDELIHVDDLSKHLDKFDARISLVVPKKAQIPSSGTAYPAAYGAPRFSPASRVTPALRENTSFSSRNPPSHSPI